MNEEPISYVLTAIGAEIIEEHDDMYYEHDLCYIVSFKIIQQYLDPGSTTTEEGALNQLYGWPVPEEHRHLCKESAHAAVKELAAHTPYWHPNQTKLASLTAGMVRRDAATESREYYFDYSIGEWSQWPEEDGYVNEQAYFARASSLVHAESVDDMSFRAIELIFEDASKVTEPTVMAASLWMIHYGTAISNVCFGKIEQLDRTLPEDSLYLSYSLYDPHARSGRKSCLKRQFQILRRKWHTRDGLHHRSPRVGPSLTPHRWSFWKQGFRDIAAGRGRYGKTSPACKQLARQAVQRMGELELEVKYD